MAQCLLDFFPVEIIHHLLSYFSAHEIFSTFTDVSSHIDDVLLIYSYYRLNFKSVTKTEFDIVCRRIVPDQVISLTLCDNRNTPGQVQHFLSLFQINQFTRLRSLTLINVGPDFWASIMTKLIELKNLRSFFYISLDEGDSWDCVISRSDVSELDQRLSDSYSPMLSQLNRLRLCHGNFLKTVQFPHLRHLILDRCSANIIQNLCRSAPHLKSLEIEVEHGKSSTEVVFPLAELNRLVLRINDSVVSMSNMEQLMSNLPTLKYLELHAGGNIDLVDGQRWQTAAERLITFNFKFNLSVDLDWQDLDSYCTPFWLVEKHWFVAFSSKSLYSVPYFTITETNEDFKLPILTTAPDNSIFYERITKLALPRLSFEIAHHFNHVHTLTLFYPIHIPRIEQVVDLSRIQHLILWVPTRKLRIVSLIDRMENLQQISIKNRVKHILAQMLGKTMEKIRKLEIGNNKWEIGYHHSDDDDDDYNMKQLCSTFPRVEHLCIVHFCSEAQISNFVHEFKYLSTASFYCTPWRIREGHAEQKRIEIQSSLDQIRRDQKLDYTYRLTNASVHIWISRITQSISD